MRPFLSLLKNTINSHTQEVAWETCPHLPRGLEGAWD